MTYFITIQVIRANHYGWAWGHSVAANALASTRIGILFAQRE